MATNADESAADDGETVTEDDLRDLKYGNGEVETSKEADETSDTGETSTSDETEENAGNTDDSDETEEQSEDSFVKQFPNIKGETPEEYAKNLEEAYRNSTTEALRLKNLSKDKTEDTETTTDTSDPVALFMKQKMDEEIQTSFQDFSKEYTQVSDPAEYDRFTSTVSTLSQTILSNESRLAPPKELYTKAAVILGWESQSAPTGKDRLNAAVKDAASTSRTSGASTKKATRSKVTDAMIAADKLMYPNKTEAEIREELEPYV